MGEIFVQVSKSDLKEDFYFLTFICNKKHKFEGLQIIRFLCLTFDEYHNILINKFGANVNGNNEFYFKSFEECKKAVDWFNENLDSILLMGDITNEECVN